jgi:hypothetical protein
MNPQGGVELKTIFSPAQSFSSFGDVVSVIVKNAFVLAGIISFVLLIFGGFMVIVSAGDTKKTESGRNAITGAVIGLLLVVGSFWIVQIINKITGLNLLQ